jgi:hypothetical protein
MKAYRGDGGIAPPFLDSALDEGEWTASRPSRFAPGTHWIGGSVGLTFIQYVIKGGGKARATIPEPSL